MFARLAAQRAERERQRVEEEAQRADDRFKANRALRLTRKHRAIDLLYQLGHDDLAEELQRRR